MKNNKMFSGMTEKELNGLMGSIKEELRQREDVRFRSLIGNVICSLKTLKEEYPNSALYVLGVERGKTHQEYEVDLMAFAEDLTENSFVRHKNLF